MSRVTAGGEIDVIDPGGFGSVTITKGITIDGAGPLSSILGAGTFGINITAAATDVVTIRNISINGFGTGTNGIRIVSAKSVLIENCVWQRGGSRLDDGGAARHVDRRGLTSSVLPVHNPQHRSFIDEEAVMIRSSSIVCVFAIFALAGVLPRAAVADTRTWVSGGGDDLNACTRTAPCATFQGAYGKTDAGGEIDALNAGSYGRIFVTKALTIDGGAGLAGIVETASAAAVNVSAGSNDVVTLRNLSMDGGGTGSFGVFVQGGRSVVIENCSIFGFLNGIYFVPVGAMTLAVTNTTIHDNSSYGMALGSTGGGFYTRVTVTQVRVLANGTGMWLSSNALVFVRDSIVANNTGNGILVAAAGDRTAELDLDGTTSSHNGGSGVVSSGVTSRVRVSNSTIDHNVAVGLLPYLGGQILSSGNNRVVGNGGGDGSVTGTVVPM